MLRSWLCLLPLNPRVPLIAPKSVRGMDRDWIVSICLKYILVCFLPLYLVIGRNYSYASVLLSLGAGGGPFPYYTGTAGSLLMPPFLAILTLPAVLFDYTVHHRPKDRSVTRLFIIVFILLNPLVQALLLTPIMAILPVAFGGNWELYSMISQAAVYAIMANTWTLPLMTVIPFFMRQVSNLSPERGASGNQKAYFSHVFTRYNLLAIFLGISIFTMPILITNMDFFYYGPYYSAPQSLVLVSGGAMVQITQNTNLFTLTFTTMIFINLMTLPIAAGLYILFIYDVFEYLKMKTSRARCIGTGILATLGAVFVVFGPSAPFSAAPNLLVFPLPTILVIGLIVMMKAGQVEVKERIWEEQPHEPWFESKEPVTQGGGGDSMEIPVSQIARSKLGGAKKQKDQYDWDHKDDDVFGQDSEAHADG